MTFINNNRTKFDWFRKPTFSRRYLNFFPVPTLTEKRHSYRHG